MVQKRLRMIIYSICCFYFLQYLISKNFNFTNRTNHFRIIKVQSVLSTGKLELNEFSGEYEELPSVQSSGNHHRYTIENIYFLLTTNTDRIRFTINFLKFWSKSAHINCLIIFEANDYSEKKSAQYLLKANNIPCVIKTSNTKRFEERYFQLIDLGWELIKREKKPIQWLALGDDDTIWLIDNLLKTLQEYNSSRVIYLGNLSDRNDSIQRHGTYYAYGGAGMLLSKPLVSLFSNYSQLCRKKFNYMFGGDEMIGKCFTKLLKINLTRNEHFHQLDHEGDIDGFFQSGVDGLVTLHHMFSLWEPFPPEHAERETEILDLISMPSKTLKFDYLKRFFRINSHKNRTLLLTHGYSFTIFNRLVTPEEFNQLELTWSGSQVYQRRTRAKETKKINFFFKQFIDPTTNSAIYQYRNKQIAITVDN